MTDKKITKQMNYQPGPHFTPFLWYNKNCFENIEKKKNCNASTF